MTARSWRFDFGPYNEVWIDEIAKRLHGRKAEYNMATILASKLLGPKPMPGLDWLIRECQQLAGDLEFHQVRGVLLPSGNEVRPHVHETMRVFLYMPHDSDAYLCFSNPTEGFITEEGRLVEIERGRNHWVTQNPGPPRTTIAVMFTEHA